MASFNADEHAAKPEFLLPESVSCNIIQIINISDSNEKVLEEWKYYDNPNTTPFERMEHVGRPVIYGIDLESEGEQKVSASKITYKLMLRDKSGNYFYGVELEEIPFLHPRDSTTKNPLPVPLGGRLVLQKGTLVSHGLALLRKHQCVYLGEDDPALSEQLNNGVVKKYIDVLERKMRPQ